MSHMPKHSWTAAHSSKEISEMFKRLFAIAASLGALMLLAVLPVASASAAEPWWQVLTGSRPTNMWEPTDNVQELETATTVFFGFTGAAIAVEVEGKVVGCLGKGVLGFFGCPGTGFPPEESAAQLEARLEAAFGTSTVEVTGGPVGVGAFTVTTPGRAVPTIKLNPIFGSGSVTVLSVGGSGILVLTLTNLGNADVDSTGTPVKIVDRLPEGVEATAVKGVLGPGATGSVECLVEAPDEVACAFAGDLPPYEAIEVEVSASLTGSPPVSGAPGEVTVSGGNAPPMSDMQTVKMSPEPTPFGIERFITKAEEEGGAAVRRAGSHPFQLSTTLQLNSGPPQPAKAGQRQGVEQPALPRNVRAPLPAGFVGNATVTPTCDMQTFLGEVAGLRNECPDNTVLGVSSVTIFEEHFGSLIRLAVPIFNLPPAHGEPARFGFMPLGTPVVIDTAVDAEHDYRIIASVRNTTEVAQFLGATLVFWGAPGDPGHDNARGWNCVYYGSVDPCERPPSLSEKAFLRQPVSCSTPLDFGIQLEPWNVPLGSTVDEAESIQPNMVGCNQVPFDPSITSAPTSKLASNPSGLDFRLDMPNSGLLNKDAITEGQAKKVEVTLPEGMTVNPSEGEGLVGCSPEEYARETASSAPGAGCPDASKVGTVEASTPLIEEKLQGALYVATPFDNPFGSLVALYIVARSPERGVLVKQAVEVRPDPRTGQLVAISDNLPQLPYDSFRLHFKEGARAPLVTPPACGDYDVVARFTPWSAQDPDNPAPNEIVTRTSTFTVERGVDGGACPSGGTPPFHPGLLAGTINNSAGTYSPFSARLTRNDGEQEFTNFSIKLPPGVVGKLAGIPFCSDAAIAAAKARTGPHGGAEELASPSCPAASQIGRTLVGAGVGASLTYVPGKAYLAGPYNGSPLSVVAITAAKVGPFDLGTVVVREALRINPETAEVFVDATGSDPIPHIIQGIPVHARDIRVYVDRPEFVLNPTSCEPTSTASTVLGSGLDFGSDADNVPVTVTSPFQAADCASLGFKPRLQLSLRGKIRRGGNPALRAVLRPRLGDANAARISVALPHSEFLDQGHIRTVCTRVQFKAGAGNGSQCPAGAVYGHARAWTPLFDHPLEGPVFLRSSEHPLPDLVLALHGLVDIQAVGRIDSANGGIRNTFDFVPDAPVTKVVVDFQGGKKSLLQNSTNVCRGKNRATVKMKGHNGKIHNFQVPLRAKCPKKTRSGHRRQR
jgi:hypothetical protein